MKTLFSFIVEKSGLKQLKERKGMSVPDVARQDINTYLKGEEQGCICSHKSPEFIYRKLCYSIPLNRDEYAKIFEELDYYYSAGKIFKISEEEKLTLAVCAAELLNLEFKRGDISQEPERYFANHFSFNHYEDYKDFSKMSFVDYVSKLCSEPKNSINPVTLMKIYFVFIAGQLTIKNEKAAEEYLRSINSIIIKLLEPLISELKNKQNVLNG